MILANVKDQGSFRCQDVLEMSNGYQTWSTEPLSKVNCIAEVKTYIGVSLGRPDVKLLRNAFWLPKSVVRTHDQIVMHSEVKRHAGVSRVEPEVNCLEMFFAFRFGRKNP